MADRDRVGLVEACDDPELFGFPLWPAQRELLDAIDAHRLTFLALGRRSSKTTTMAIVGLHACLLRPELRAFLRPGERGYAVGVATRLPQARLLVAAARSIVERSPVLAGMVEGATEDEIRFSNGMTFAAFPCTSRGGRGWPVACLLMDEAAHYVDTDGNSAAERVWTALSPSTAQFGELARIVVGSTPWGSSGWFHDTYQRAAGGELEGASAHRAASAEVNPTLSETFLASERVVLGEEGFAGEYLADFVGSGGAFLEPAAIDGAIVDRGELDPGEATRWVAGLDPAFSSDPFGLALVGRDRERGVLVLGLARRWLPRAGRGGSFEERRRVEDSVLAEVAEVCKFYGAPAVTDQFSAPAVVERLREYGVVVRTEAMTATSKSLAYSEVRQRLAAGELELYQQPDLLVELRRLRSRFAAGHATVVNPRVGDSHGDVAQALAQAVWAHRSWRPGGKSGRFSVPQGRVPEVASGRVGWGELSPVRVVGYDPSNPGPGVW